MREQAGMLDGTFTAAPQAGPWFDTGGEGYSLVAMVTVSALSGAGATATFVLEDSEDGVNAASTPLQTVGSVTAPGTYALRASGSFARFARVRLSALAGTTPSITSAAKAIARD